MIGRKPISSSPSVLNEFAKGLSRGTDTLQQSLGNASQYLGDKVGSDTLRDFGQEVAERNAIEAMDPDNAAAIGTWDDVNSISDFTKYAASNVGSSLPYMLPMALTGGAGAALGAGAKGVQALSAIGLAPSMIGETYQQALDHGYSDDDMGMLATATGKTLLNFLPVGRAMSLITGRGKMLKGLPLTAGTEGLTEAGEEMLDANLRAQHDSDFDMMSPEQRRQYTESAIAGATTGGAVHVASAGLGTVSKALNTGMNVAKESQRMINDQRPSEYKIQDAGNEIINYGEMSDESKRAFNAMGVDWQEFQEGVLLTQQENAQREMSGQETIPAILDDETLRQQYQPQSEQYLTEQGVSPDVIDQANRAMYGEPVTPEQKDAELRQGFDIQDEAPINEQQIGPEASPLGRTEYDNQQQVQAAAAPDISNEGDSGATVTDVTTGLDNQTGAGSTWYESADKANRIKKSLDTIAKTAGLQDQITTEVGTDQYDAIKDRDVPVDVLQAGEFDPAKPETTANARKLTIKNIAEGATVDTSPMRALRDSYRETETVDATGKMGPRKSYQSSYDEETFVKSRMRDGLKEKDTRAEFAQLTKGTTDLEGQVKSLKPEAEQLIEGLQNKTTQNAAKDIKQVHRLQAEEVSKLRQQGFSVPNEFTGGANAKGIPLPISDLKRLSMQGYLQSLNPKKKINLNKELRTRAAQAMKGSNITSQDVLAAFAPKVTGRKIKLDSKESWQDYMSPEEKQAIITRADGKAANMTPFERELLQVKLDQVNRAKGTVTTDNARWVTAIEGDEASGDGRWEMGRPESKGVSSVTTVGGVVDAQATADRINDIQANDPQELSFADFLIGEQANADLMSSTGYQKYLIEGLNRYGLQDISKRIQQTGLAANKGELFTVDESNQIADAIESENKAEKQDYMLEEGVADKRTEKPIEKPTGPKAVDKEKIAKDLGRANVKKEVEEAFDKQQKEESIAKRIKVNKKKKIKAEMEAAAEKFAPKGKKKSASAGATVEQTSTMRKMPDQKKGKVPPIVPPTSKTGGVDDGGKNKPTVSKSFASGEEFDVAIDDTVAKGHVRITQPRSTGKILAQVNPSDRDIDDNVLLDSYKLGLGQTKGGTTTPQFTAIIGKPGRSKFSSKLEEKSPFVYNTITGGNPDHDARVLKAIHKTSATFKATNDYGTSFDVRKGPDGKIIVSGSLKELHGMSETGIVSNIVLAIQRAIGKKTKNATVPEAHKDIRKEAEKIRFDNEIIEGSYYYNDPYKSLVDQPQSKMTDSKFNSIFAGINFQEAKESYYHPKLVRNPDGSQTLVATKDTIIGMSDLAAVNLRNNLTEELIAAQNNAVKRHEMNNKSIDEGKFISGDIKETYYDYQGNKKELTIQENSEAKEYQEILDTLHWEKAQLLQMHQEYNSDRVENPAAGKKIQGQKIAPVIEKRKEMDRVIRRIENERKRLLNENNIKDDVQEAIRESENEHKINIYTGSNLEGYSSFTDTFDMNVYNVLSPNQKSRDRDTKEFLESTGNAQMVRKQPGVKGEITQAEYDKARKQLRSVLDFNELDAGSQDQKIRDVALVNRSQALFVASPLKGRKISGTAKYAVQVALKQNKPVYAVDGQEMYKLNEIGLAEKHRFVPAYKDIAFLGGIANNPASNRAAQAILDKYTHFAAAVNNTRYLNEQLGSSFNPVKGQKNLQYNPETNRYSGNVYQLGKKTLEELINMRPASEAKKVLNKYKYRFIPNALDKGTVTNYLEGDTDYILKIDPKTKIVRGNARILEALNTAGMEKFIEKAHKSYIETSASEANKTQTFTVSISGALHDMSYNVNVSPEGDTAIKTPTTASTKAEKKRRNEFSTSEVKDWYKYWTNGKDHREITDVINTATKDMPFKVSVMTPGEAHVFYKAEKELHGERDDFKERYENLKLGGYATPKIDKDGNYRIFVHPQFEGELRDTIAKHELGHVVKYHLWNSSDSRAKNAIFAEFEKFRENYGKDNDSVHELLRKKKTPLDAENLISMIGVDRTLGEIDPELRDYYTDFDEWFADQTAMAYVSNQDTANSNVVKRFFKEFVKMLKQLMGKNQVEKYIDSLNNGNYNTKKKV